jgi:hypothetical protein
MAISSHITHIIDAVIRIFSFEAWENVAASNDSKREHPAAIH